MLSRVLRADFKYVYQLALLKSELEEIFARAPPIQNTDAGAASTPADDEKRKPIEGDCSVCYSEFEPAKEKIVWCRAACGQNFHQKCFDTWAATKRTSGRSQVTCPMCRSVWQGDDGGGLALTISTEMDRVIVTATSILRASWVSAPSEACSRCSVYRETWINSL